MAIAQEEHPVPPATQWTWTSDPKCVRLARDQLRRYLGQWRAENIAESGVLLLSEPMTNSVKHAATSHTSRDIETVFDLSTSVLRVEVTDVSNRLPSMRHPGDTDENGRGLSLVAIVSSRWGVAPGE